jgi:hypothetical protein
VLDLLRRPSGASTDELLAVYHLLPCPNGLISVDVS